jgi:ABC-type transport system involved in multi-copper enzyme maturation permease subunit
VTGLGASLLLARITWKRMLRGRALWLTLVMLAMPLVMVLAGPGDPGRWRVPVNVFSFLLAVVPPLHLATAISDEVEDQTITYLWSRPIARWSLLAGKMIAVVPALIAVFAVAMAAAFVALYGGSSADHLDVLVRGIAGVSVGVVAIGMLAIGFGSVMPKYPLAVVVAYMLIVDLAVGKIPFAVNALSITHHVRTIAGVPEKFERYAVQAGLYDAGTVMESVVWALAIGAAWFGLALWRVSRAEYANKG